MTRFPLPPLQVPLSEPHASGSSAGSSRSNGAAAPSSCEPMVGLVRRALRQELRLPPGSGDVPALISPVSTLPGCTQLVMVVTLPAGMPAPRPEALLRRLLEGPLGARLRAAAAEGAADVELEAGPLHAGGGPGVGGSGSVSSGGLLRVTATIGHEFAEATAHATAQRPPTPSSAEAAAGAGGASPPSSSGDGRAAVQAPPPETRAAAIEGEQGAVLEWQFFREALGLPQQQGDQRTGLWARPAALLLSGLPSPGRPQRTHQAPANSGGTTAPSLPSGGPASGGIGEAGGAAAPAAYVQAAVQAAAPVLQQALPGEEGQMQWLEMGGLDAGWLHRLIPQRESVAAGPAYAGAGSPAAACSSGNSEQTAACGTYSSNTRDMAAGTVAKAEAAAAVAGYLRVILVQEDRVVLDSLTPVAASIGDKGASVR
jgi:hypothetical protein